MKLHLSLLRALAIGILSTTAFALPSPDTQGSKRDNSCQQITSTLGTCFAALDPNGEAVACVADDQLSPCRPWYCEANGGPVILVSASRTVLFVQ